MKVTHDEGTYDGQFIPELPLGSSIFRHRDECIRIAKWADGTTALGNGGIWVDTKGGLRELAPLGSYLVKRDGVIAVYTADEFSAEYEVLEEVQDGDLQVQDA